MNPLLEQFLQEARENLKFIEQNLEDLGNGDDELLNSIFRAAHTLKGGSGIVGFEAVKNITHKAEDLLDSLRSKKLEYKSSMLDALYDAFDEVLNLIEAAEESSDVVDADEETEKRIVDYLSKQMGEDSAVEQEWSAPIRLCENLEDILKFKTLNLNSIDGKIPFEKTVLNESNFSEERLYLLFFDLDSDCMMFGNDPIYALSLLDEKVLSISSTFSKDSGKDILTNFEDEEGLNLHLQLVALVNASYEEIEEALYNFLDDMIFHPFDISSYISFEACDFDIEFIKDLSKKAKELLKNGDLDNLKDVLTDSISLMNSDSKQALILNRVINILDYIYENDLPKLIEFFNNLAGIDDSKDEIKEVAKTTTEQTAENQATDENTQSSETKPEENLEFSDLDKDVAMGLLLQQREQLQANSDNETLQRVKAISEKCFIALGVAFDSYNSSDELLSKLSEVLDSKDSTTKTEPAQTEKENTKVTKETPVKAKVVKPEVKKDIIGKVVKINQESIDNLMSVVGELLVAKNSLPYLADNVFGLEPESIKRAILEKYSFIDRLTNQLQDLIMSMRMLPISYVFDRYPKLVREISKKLNKKVKLSQEGGDTKLDKNMIEMLADPLIHIVRNSLDHGVEEPQVRKESGKSETGLILMKAYPQSDKVIIEIHDDGKGIDSQRVINKVLEKNLMDIDRIEQLTEDEKLNLIFLPGLSTVDEISEFSGRGVGMDVVKKSIESFGGDVYLKSQPGRGTQLVMSIPVSLAVSTLLHVSMDGLHYGFPMDSVNETVKIDVNEITYLNNEPFVYIRGQVIPLIMIKDMLQTKDITNEPLSIVVLDVKDNTIAIVVNELLGQLDVVQKPLEGMLSTHPLLSGTALLGNGQIIMIFDPVGILELSDDIKLDKI